MVSKGGKKERRLGYNLSTKDPGDLIPIVGNKDQGLYTGGSTSTKDYNVDPYRYKRLGPGPSSLSYSKKGKSLPV